MKKFTSFVLIAMMIMSLASFAVSAAATTFEGTEVTWELVDGVMTIDGTGAMPDYRGAEGSRPWIDQLGEITKVVVKGGVTHVGSSSFTEATALEEVVLEEGVLTVGMDAFSYVDTLTTVTFPASLTELKQGVFYSADGITTVNYPGTSDEFKANVTRANYNDDYIFGATWSNDPVVDEPESDANLVISPYNPGGLNGWENWSDQTQLLIVTDVDVPDNYTWYLTLSDGTKTSTIKLVPASSYDTWLDRFEVCLGTNGNQFVPVNGTEYTISAKVYDTEGNLAFVSDPAAGFICGLDPIVPETVENPANLVIGPYGVGSANGWENWSDQTQLLITTESDVNNGFTWEITIAGSTIKTITLVPSSSYDTWLDRFEVCLGEGENQFIPVNGEEYIVSAKVYDTEGNLAFVAAPVAGFNCAIDPIVPTPVDPEPTPDTPVEPEPTPDTPVEPEPTPDAPQTGDATVYAIVLAVVALMGMGVVVTKKVRA